MRDLRDLTPPELLVMHAAVSEELRRRGVIRSSNNPVGDLAEYLFCRAFGWKQAPNSMRDADATDSDHLPRWLRFVHDNVLAARFKYNGRHSPVGTQHLVFERVVLRVGSEPRRGKNIFFRIDFCGRSEALSQDTVHFRF